MKTIFNENVINELVGRIKSLELSASKNWGKMNSAQMLKHCVETEKMFQGEIKPSRVFIGRIFGKMALKSVLKNAKPLDKNQPTHKNLKITENPDFSSTKNEWIDLLKKYPTMSKVTFHGFVHPFFGKMDKEQIGTYNYKHIDHHLRQFGV
jgi:hypothetical protein